MWEWGHCTSLLLWKYPRENLCSSHYGLVWICSVKCVLLMASSIGWRREGRMRRGRSSRQEIERGREARPIPINIWAGLQLLSCHSAAVAATWNFCGVLRCVAVCCSALRWVAVCYSALQCMLLYGLTMSQKFQVLSCHVVVISQKIYVLSCQVAFDVLAMLQKLQLLYFLFVAIPLTPLNAIWRDVCTDRYWRAFGSICSHFWSRWEVSW